MAPLPAPIRAGLGLLATALDTVQELVEHAPEIPMEAVGNSMQLSLRLQQQYAALLTRGDEFIAGLRGAPDEPPSWATFDDEPSSSADGTDLAADDAPGGSSGGGGAIFDDDVLDVPAAELQEEPRHAGQGDPLLDAVLSATPAATGPARKKAPGTKVPAKKAPGKKAPAKKVAGPPAAATKAGARKAPAAAALAEQDPARKLSAKNAPAKKAPGTKSPARKTAARKAAAAGSPGAIATADSLTAAPQLDAALANGEASARPRSAFDLAEPTDDALTDSAATGGATPNDSLPVDVPVIDSPIVDALVDGEPAGQDAPGSIPGP